MGNRWFFEKLTCLSGPTCYTSPIGAVKLIRIGIFGLRVVLHRGGTKNISSLIIIHGVWCNLKSEKQSENFFSGSGESLDFSFELRIYTGPDKSLWERSKQSYFTLSSREQFGRPRRLPPKRKREREPPKVFS